MEWISVEDRLPITEESLTDLYAVEEVICCFEDGRVVAGEFHAGRTNGFWCGFEDMLHETFENVSYWMPLPPPPRIE